MLYAPSPFVVVSRVRLVSLLTIVTVAPGMNAPELSLTTPTTLPYRICAETGTADRPMASARPTTIGTHAPDRNLRTISLTGPSSRWIGECQLVHGAMKSIARRYYRRGGGRVNANEDNFLRLPVVGVNRFNDPFSTRRRPSGSLRPGDRPDGLWPGRSARGS